MVFIESKDATEHPYQLGVTVGLPDDEDIIAPPTPAIPVAPITVVPTHAVAPIPTPPVVPVPAVAPT